MPSKKRFSMTDGSNTCTRNLCTATHTDYDSTSDKIVII